MPDAITLSLDSKVFRQNLKRLNDVEVGRAMASALNKTAFEVLDAEKAEASRVFRFAGASTERFLSGRGSFGFKGAKPDHLVVEISPKPKTEQILAPHQSGATLTGATKHHLTAHREFATPVRADRGGAAKVGARGRVPKRLLPGTLLSEGGRGFRAGKAILVRKGGSPRAKGAKKIGRRGKVEVVFALSKTVKLDPVFEFYNVARRTAEREWPTKAKRAFEKIRFPASL